MHAFLYTKERLLFANNHKAGVISECSWPEASGCQRMGGMNIMGASPRLPQYYDSPKCYSATPLRAAPAVRRTHGHLASSYQLFWIRHACMSIKLRSWPTNIENMIKTDAACIRCLIDLCNIYFRYTHAVQVGEPILETGIACGHVCLQHSPTGAEFLLALVFLLRSTCLLH